MYYILRRTLVKVGTEYVEATVSFTEMSAKKAVRFLWAYIK